MKQDVKKVLLEELASPKLAPATDGSAALDLATGISCLRRFFPLPAAVKNGNYKHVFILFSQLVQLLLEVVVPPRNFGLVEDDLGLCCVIVHNSMSSGINIDQQPFFTADRFDAFPTYLIILFFHVIVGGVL